MHRLLKQILSILNIFQYRAPVDALRRAQKNSRRKMLCGAVWRFPAVILIQYYYLLHFIVDVSCCQR